MLKVGNFCDHSNYALNPHIVQWYKWHMWYVSNSDHMANSYYVSQLTLKWTPKLLFHFLDLTVLSSWILLSMWATLSIKIQTCHGVECDHRS